MSRRVGAHGCAWPSAAGRGFGAVFRGSFDGTEQPRNWLCLLPLGLTVGRSSLHAQRSGSESPAGQPRISGDVAAETAPAPDRKT